MMLSSWSDQLPIDRRLQELMFGLEALLPPY